MGSKQSSALTYVLDRVEPDGQQAERRPLDQLWFGNLAYYSGNVHFIAEDGTIRLPRRLRPQKSRYKANLIAPAVLRNVSRLMAVNMTFSVAPNSGSIQDREGARIANKMWEHIQDVTRFRQKRMNALLWAAICGAGYLKVTWDPLGGVPHRAYFDDAGNIVNGFPLEERDAALAGRFEELPEGEVAIEVVNPFQLHWDWIAREEGIEGASWLAQVHTASIEGLVDRYGEDLRNKVRGEETDAGTERYEEAISTMSAGMYGLNLGQTPNSMRHDRTRVIEFFERPMKKNKDRGRYILVAGGHVIRDEENPYLAFGCPLPFVRFGWWPMPGRFTPLSLVEQLRGPQKAYNESRSYQHDVERTNGYPVTIVPSNAGVKSRKLVSFPGVILEVNQGAGAVQNLPAPQLPPYIGENASRSREELNSIAANSTPAKESYPAGIRSSLAIQAMQEDNNAILTPTMEMLVDAVREAGRMALQISSKQYSVPRSIRTMGKGNDYEVELFTGDEMRGNTQLRFFGEPSRLETSSSYQERMMAMIEIGALDPQKPEDRVAILKAMDAKTSDELLNDQLADERQEELWLNRVLRDPQFDRPPIGHENPVVRAKVLERFMKSESFYEAANVTKGRIIERWQGWSKMIQEQLMAQLQMQQAMSGSQPAQKGTPSAPRRSAANTAS